MNDMKKYLEKKIPHLNVVTLCISFIIMMIYLSFRDVTKFYYDSWWYWTVGEPVFFNGVHFTNFPETFRGYVWPIILQIIKISGDAVDGEIFFFRAVMSASVALFFSVILPVLFDKKIRTVFDSVRIIAVILIMLFFLGDFFTNPLSDFAAVFFLTVGTVLIKINIDSETRKLSLLEGGIAGAFLYAAYNTRAAYLYGVFLAVIYMIAMYKKGKRIKKTFALGMIIGCAIIALPQSLINHKYTGSYSPKVFTEQLANYKHSLEKRHLLWGLLYPNYETNVGPEEEYPSASMVFIDKVGHEIVSREKISEDNFTYGKFFKLFFKYPMDITSIYVRHFVSMMTPKFPESYIRNVYPEKGMLILAILVMWFVTICNLLHDIKKKNVNWKAFGLVFIVIVPSLIQFLGYPEVRFFIGIHVICYFYTVYYVDYSDHGAFIKNNIFPIFVCFILFAFLWIGVLSSILSSNKEKTLLIDDKNIYRLENSNIAIPEKCEVILGKSISFRSADSSACSKAEGLSVNEPWGTWSDGKKVIMKMQVKEGKNKSLFLEVNALPYLNEAVKEQTVKVFANGHKIAEWHVAKPDIYRAKIPASAMPTDNLKLVFKISDPILLEGRNLGIGLYDMVIRETKNK